MNSAPLDRLLGHRYLVAAFAGLIMAASFPNINIAGFAWIAPGLMLLAAFGTTGWESFRVGYLAGLVHYLASLYWLLLIPYRWHGIPVGPAAGWLALGAFLALFPAMWVWTLTEVRGAKCEVRGKKSGSSFSSSSSASSSLSSSSPCEPQAPPRHVGGYNGWSGRVLWAISGAVAWVGMEMFIARVFSGFPWDLLGVSQHQLIPLIQVASITGIYGVSFMIVWTSLSLLMAVTTILRKPADRSAWVPDIILPAIVILILFVYGMRRTNAALDSAATSANQRTIRVTFIQPSIPQTLIWDETKTDERFSELLELTAQALTNKTDLVLWPEAAVPKLFRYYKDMYEPITEMAREHHVWMIIGADDMEPNPVSKRPEDADYFNSSFLIGPDGELRGTYRKRGLVIFGEYVPLVRWLPFMKYLTPVQGSFTPGQSAVPFRLTTLGVNTSVLICFEDIFPHLARQYVNDDTDFLVNITNNGWFDESAAQWQHGMTAVFRAIENGVPLLRCSNNGLTCWVDQFGRVRKIFFDAKGTIYGPGFMLADIPVGGKHPQTFYNAHGDVFGWVCVGLSVLLVFRRAFQLRQMRNDRLTA